MKKDIFRKAITFIMALVLVFGVVITGAGGMQKDVYAAGSELTVNGQAFGIPGKSFIVGSDFRLTDLGIRIDSGDLSAYKVGYRIVNLSNETVADGIKNAFDNGKFISTLTMNTSGLLPGSYTASVWIQKQESLPEPVSFALTAKIGVSGVVYTSGGPWSVDRANQTGPHVRIIGDGVDKSILKEISVSEDSIFNDEIIIDLNSLSSENYNLITVIRLDYLKKWAKIYPDAKFIIKNRGIVYPVPFNILDNIKGMENFSKSDVLTELWIKVYPLQNIQQEKALELLTSEFTFAAPTSDFYSASFEFHDLNGAKYPFYADHLKDYVHFELPAKKETTAVVLLDMNSTESMLGKEKISLQKNSLAPFAGIPSYNENNAARVTTKANGVFVSVQYDIGFKDVADHFASQFITEAAARGFIQVGNDGKFAPDEPITQEEFLAMFINGMGLSVLDDNGLPVKRNSWYGGYEEAVKRYGLRSCLSEYLDKPLTKSQMVDLLTSHTEKNYPDADIEELMKYAASASIDSTVTKAEATAVFIMLLEELKMIDGSISLLPAAKTNDRVIKIAFLKVKIGDTMIQADDNQIQMDMAPYISKASNSAMVPLRPIAVAMGIDGEMIAYNGLTKIVSIQAGNDLLQFKIGESSYYANDEARPMISSDGKPIYTELQKGRIFVPLRVLIDAFGGLTSWDNSTITVTFSKD